MTTIKNFTDITQSKKLAKILPLKSADAFYDSAEPEKRQRVIVGSPDEYFDMEDWAIPCWSLAALLEEIPEIINFDDDESDYALEILKESGLYYLSYGNLLEHDKIEIEPQEYFVDACYEMIIKLHKEGLL